MNFNDRVVEQSLTVKKESMDAGFEQFAESSRTRWMIPLRNSSKAGIC